jgi:WD40 repeat protein
MVRRVGTGLVGIIVTVALNLFAQTDPGIQPRLEHAAGLLNQGKIGEARSELTSLTASYPQDPRPFYLLAVIDAQDGKSQEADRELRASIQAAPGFFPAHWVLGEQLAGAGKLDEGIAELREAVRLDPQVAEVHLSLGMVLDSMGANPEAALEFQAAARLEPQKYLSPVRVLRGHTNRVWTMIFSPDSKMLASGSLDKTVKVWEIEFGRSLDTYQFTGQASPTGFSPDGKVIATNSSDLLSKKRSSKFWDVNTGQEAHLGRTPADLNSIAFTQDWRYVARYVPDKEQIEIWDFEKGTLLHTLNPGESPFLSLAKFSRDGSLFATPGDKNTAKVYDVRTGKEILSVQGEPAAAELGIVNVFFNPDGTLLTIVDALKNLKLCDIKTGRVVKTQAVDLGGINVVEYVALSPDGRWLATETSSGRALLTDLAEGNTWTLFGHGRGVNGVAISPDGRWLATSSWTGEIRLWEIPTK